MVDTFVHCIHLNVWRYCGTVSPDPWVMCSIFVNFVNLTSNQECRSSRQLYILSALYLAGSLLYLDFNLNLRRSRKLTEVNLSSEHLCEYRHIFISWYFSIGKALLHGQIIMGRMTEQAQK